MNAVSDEAAGGSLQVAGALPCGPRLDWDADADLALIRAEIDKSSAIPPLPVDWPLVLTKSQQLLRTSTDWVLLCAAARASAHVRGVGGLTAAIDAFGVAVERFGDDIHPSVASSSGNIPREAQRASRRRARFLEWFESGLATDLGSNDTTRVPRADEDVAAALKKLEWFDEILRRTMKPYPGVRRLREALERLRDMSEAVPAREAAPRDAANSREHTPSATGVEFPPPIDSVDTAERVLTTIRDALFSVANALQEFEGSDSRAFRIRRTAAWLKAGSVQPQEGKLPMQGPSSEQAQTLRKTLDVDPQSALEQSENYLVKHPLWLDLNYVAFLALTAVGRRKGGAAVAECDRIADAIRLETFGLVRRVPSLVGLTFANGTPLADPDTQSWLRDAFAKPIFAAKTEGPPQAEPDVIAVAEAAAGQFVQQGNFAEGFKVLDDGIKGASSERERFRWRLAAARHAARHGRADFAISVLEGLYRQAFELNLDRWEPDLCVEVLKALLSVGGNGHDQPEKLRSEIIKRLPDIPLRLARLDLMEALELDKANS